MYEFVVFLIFSLAQIAASKSVDLAILEPKSLFFKDIASKRCSIRDEMTIGSFEILTGKSKLATLNWDLDLKIWNYQTGELDRTVQLAKELAPEMIGIPDASAISKSGRKVACATKSKVIVFDLDKTDIVRVHSIESEKVKCLTFSLDEKVLFIGTRSSNFFSIVLENGNLLSTKLGKNSLGTFASQQRILNISGTDSILIQGMSGLDNGAAILRNDTLKRSRLIDGLIFSASLSSDGQFAALVRPIQKLYYFSQSRIEVIKLANCEKVFSVDFDQVITSVSLSHDGALLACTGNDYGAIYSTLDGKRKLKYSSASAFFLSDSRYFASFSAKNDSIAILDLKTRTYLRPGGFKEK